MFTYRTHLPNNPGGTRNYTNAVAWSPDSKRVASGAHDVRVWNALDGSPIFTYTRHTASVYALAWSPDGTRIASAGGG